MKPYRIIFVSGIFLLTVLVFSCKKHASPPVADGGVPATIIQPVAVTKTNNQKLFVAYQPWFENKSTSPDGKWGQHWTMATKNPDIILSNGNRQIASWFYPLIGPYASSDSDVIDYHTLLMKYSGIDGVIADWSGTHQVYDYPLIKRNTDALFYRIPKVGLQFAITYEDATLRYVQQQAAIDTILAAQQDFAFLQANYFNKPWYTHINDQPLVLCFGPQVLQTEDRWRQVLAAVNPAPRLISLWYQGDASGAMGSGEFGWASAGFLDDLQYFYQNRAWRFPTAIAAAYPGFKDFYAAGGWGNTLLTIDHNGSNTMQSTLDYAGTSGLDILQLITWNDFGEGTMIEPTQEFSYSFLEAIQAYTGVKYTKTELELIYRWYTLRKSNKADASIEDKLTQAYYYLVSLDVPSATNILSAIP